jgi:hypothetical protein
MSRRKVNFMNKFRQAGQDVNKIIPTGAVGSGLWLTKAEIPGREMDTPRPGDHKGKRVTEPVGTRKEALLRKWGK